MEDETLALHFEVLGDKVADTAARVDNLRESTATGFGEVSQWRGETDQRLATVETKVSSVLSNPLIKLGAAGVGGTGVIGAIVYYIQQSGAPIP